jgi:hypothetical protein
MKPRQPNQLGKASCRREQVGWQGMNRKQRREMTRKIQAADLSLEVVHPDAAGMPPHERSRSSPGVDRIHRDRVLRLPRREAAEKRILPRVLFQFAQGRSASAVAALWRRLRGSAPSRAQMVGRQARSETGRDSMRHRRDSMTRQLNCTLTARWDSRQDAETRMNIGADDRT